jgi:hypothetical protein
MPFIKSKEQELDVGEQASNCQEEAQNIYRGTRLEKNALVTRLGIALCMLITISRTIIDLL